MVNNVRHHQQEGGWMVKSERVKVIIHCKRCGEKFTLRGRRAQDKIETGFKQCICSNDQDFEMITVDL